MNVSTWNNLMNENDLDTTIGFTLADAIGYVEFEEQCQNWEDVVED